jgi:hypothetical protein
MVCINDMTVVANDQYHVNRLILGIISLISFP